MKKFLPLLLLFCVIGCTHTVKKESQHDISKFTEIYYEPDYASGFRIKSLPDDSTSLMIEVYSPDTARIVIPRGGFRRVVAMSSTYVAHLELSDRVDRLVGVSSPQYISSPAVRAMSLPDVGYDGAMNYERLLTVKPEIVMLYGVGGPSPIVPKLEELGIPYIYISDFSEQLPLGRVEWLVASGALTGADMRAVFDEIRAAYVPTKGDKAVMMNAPYGGTWFIPGMEGYMSRLINDAGAKIVAPQRSGSDSTPIDSEEALNALTKADLWLCPGAATNRAELDMAVPKAHFYGDIWNQTADFYESGAVRPDSVLRELKMIVQGTTPADSLRYFYKVK